jgi:uncharacterized C2H2 Zn-finger protein
MPRENRVCPNCNMIFECEAGVEYLEDGSKLVKCPHCKLKFETLPQGYAYTGVDPKGVV